MKEKNLLEIKTLVKKCNTLIDKMKETPISEDIELTNRFKNAVNLFENFIEDKLLQFFDAETKDEKQEELSRLIESSFIVSKVSYLSYLEQLVYDGVLDSKDHDKIHNQIINLKELLDLNKKIY